MTTAARSRPAHLPALGTLVLAGRRKLAVVAVLSKPEFAIALVAAAEEVLAPVFAVPLAKLAWDRAGFWYLTDDPPLIVPALT